MQFQIKGELELKLGENDAGSVRLSAVLGDTTADRLSIQSKPVCCIESGCDLSDEVLEPYDVESI